MKNFQVFSENFAGSRDLEGFPDQNSGPEPLFWGVFGGIPGKSKVNNKEKFDKFLKNYAKKPSKSPAVIRKI